MGERNIVGKIKKYLVEKCYFYEDLIKLEPNLEEISPQVFQSVFSQISQKKRTPDIYYYDKKNDFSLYGWN